MYEEFIEYELNEYIYKLYKEFHKLTRGESNNFKNISDEIKLYIKKTTNLAILLNSENIYNLLKKFKMKLIDLNTNIIMVQYK